MFTPPRSRVLLLVSLALAGGWVALMAQLPPAPLAPPPPDVATVLRDYQPVTADRLTHPDADNWLMIRRTYDGWGYSPLTQIVIPPGDGLLQVVGNFGSMLTAAQGLVQPGTNAVGYAGCGGGI